jgi:hypothetical protein
VRGKAEREEGMKKGGGEGGRKNRRVGGRTK